MTIILLIYWVKYEQGSLHSQWRSAEITYIFSVPFVMHVFVCKAQRKRREKVNQLKIRRIPANSQFSVCISYNVVYIFMTFEQMTFAKIMSYLFVH